MIAVKEEDLKEESLGMSVVKRGVFLRIFGFIFVMFLAFGLVFLGASFSDPILAGIDKLTYIEPEELGVLRGGVDALFKEDNYVIATAAYEGGRSTVNYIEVVGENRISHKEVVVDKEGKLGEQRYGEVSEQTYRLLDWFDGENYYIFQGDNIYQLPQGIQKYVKSRDVLYGYDLLNSVLSVERMEDIVMGEKVYKGYRARVSSKEIWKSLALNSWCSYATLYEDQSLTDDLKKSVGDLCRVTEENFTFSDADVVFGLDSVGRLGYLEITMGGLGSRIHIQKEVHFGNTNVREIPKGFESALPYKEYMREILKK